MAEQRPLPAQIVKYLEHLDLTPTQHQLEIEAYWKIQALIDSTTDQFAKRVHVQTMEYVLDGEAKLTYCVEQVFPMALSEQRAAQKKLRPFALFAAIERILAGAIYTSNFGESRRWPLHTGTGYSISKKLPRNGALEDLALPANLSGAYYEFGVHTFRVGRVVEEIMRMIEKRYDLDFAALEKARKAK